MNIKIETLTDLDAFISREFQSEKFKDIDTINGIQVSHSANQIKRLAFAVDSSLETIQMAIQEKSDVLFVHHGFFWGTALALVGAHYEKIKLLLESDTALYALHLPLDAHIELGNNAQLAKRVGIYSPEAFGSYQGQHIGVIGNLEADTTFEDIYNSLYLNDNYGNSSIAIIKSSHNTTEHKAISYYNSGAPIRRIAIISGGGTRQLDEAKDCGADLYITGDANHTALLRAKELGLSVIFGGHYFTEVWGPLAVGKYIQSQSSLDCVFIDNPTTL